MRLLHHCDVTLPGHEARQVTKHDATTIAWVIFCGRRVSARQYSPPAPCSTQSSGCLHGCCDNTETMRGSSNMQGREEVPPAGERAGGQ